MRLIDTLFQRHNIEYFARGGTLLGAVRQGGFMPWDHDVDIAVPIDRYESLVNLSEEFKRYGLRITQNTKHKYRLALRDMTDSHGAYCDICFYWIGRDFLGQKRAFFADKWMRYATSGFFLKEEIYPLQRGKFGNFMINIPKNPMPYLDRHYGKEWPTIARTKESFNGQMYRFEIMDFSPIPDENFNLEEDALE
jgi:hypothetical protein